MPATAVMRPPRCVPRKRQRRPEQASGLMSCAAQAIADSKEIARMKQRFRLPVRKDDKDVSGQDGITISPRKIVYYGSGGGILVSPVIRRAPRLKVTN